MNKRQAHRLFSNATETVTRFEGNVAHVTFKSVSKTAHGPADVIGFPKVHRNGKSPKLADLQPKREAATDKIKATLAVIWKPGGAM